MWKAQTKEAVLREIRIREWRRQVGKIILRTLGWLLVNIAKGIVTTLGWLKWQSAKIAHDVELNRLLSQRNDKILRLGETVYAMYRSSETSWEVVEPFCQEIEKIDRQLDSMKTLPLQVLPQEAKQKEILPKESVASQ